MKPKNTDDETILAALRRGETQAAVARDHRAGRTRVAKLARQHGIEPQNLPGPRTKPLSPEVEALVLKALRSGTGRRVIATMFEIGQERLQRFADAHGIPRGRPGRKPGFSPKGKAGPRRKRAPRRKAEPRPSEAGLAELHRVFTCGPRPKAVEGRPRW